MSYCGFNTEPFCSDVCGDHRRPQTLAEICRNMGICCCFRAVATRGKYPGFILFSGMNKPVNVSIQPQTFSFKILHMSTCVICKMAAILSKPHCVSPSKLSDACMWQYTKLGRLYTPAPPKVERGYTGFTLMSVRPSVCPSVRPSVRPSVCRQGFRNFSRKLLAQFISSLGFILMG